MPPPIQDNKDRHLLSPGLNVLFVDTLCLAAAVFAVCSPLVTKTVAARCSGSRGRSRWRPRPMKRSMTFPGMLPLPVSGEDGEQEVLRAREQEVSFEALSTRPTEVSVVVRFGFVGRRGKLYI